MERSANAVMDFIFLRPTVYWEELSSCFPFCSSCSQYTSKSLKCNAAFSGLLFCRALFYPAKQYLVFKAAPCDLTGGGTRHADINLLPIRQAQGFRLRSKLRPTSRPNKSDGPR